jgi:hypothetical protein
VEAGVARFVVIGNPGSERIDFFQGALVRQGQPEARVVPYAELIAGRAKLRDAVQGGGVVRIESPGECFEVEKAILSVGAELCDEEGSYARATREQVERLEFDRGAILYPRQWYIGYRRVLGLIAEQLRDCPPHTMMSSPGDIATMFDKPGCHALLESHGIPVPRGLGRAGSFDELMERMSEARCYRVFVKLAHGSSASGVVAYRVSGDRHEATTTVEMAPGPDGLRLYNSRRLRVYTDRREIAALVDALCRHRVHVEQWLPKGGLDGRTFDLRVLVIAGKARHVVVRLSRGTVTNLHLSNMRTGLQALLARVDGSVWEAARRTCERVMEVFPSTLYAGIDLLITSDLRRHAVAEVNAFGDLLYGAVHDGMDPYEAEISCELSALQPSAVSRQPSASELILDSVQR